MKFVRNIAFLFFGLLLCATGCRQKTETRTTGTPLPAADSSMLSLALAPTMDCLPFYYAEASGIYKSLGLKVKIHSSLSQFDRDTALLGNSADGILSDLIRTQYYTGKGHALSVVMRTNGKWALVASKSSRLRDVNKLKKRMIGVARLSASDFHCEKIITASGIKYEDVFRPQVNDLRLRTSMLDENQIETAVLPEPFATVAQMHGHKVLRMLPQTQETGCLTFRRKSLNNTHKAAAVRLLIEGYRQATDSLNNKGKAICEGVLRSVYELTSQEIDSLQLYRYEKPKMPSGNTIEETATFLKRHGNPKRHVTAKHLLDDTYLTR